MPFASQVPCLDCPFRERGKGVSLIRNELIGGLGLLSVLAGILLLQFAPERSQNLLARTVTMAPTSDTVEGGHSESRLLPDPQGARCLWKLRPGFRYPWAGLHFDLVHPNDGFFDLSWSKSIHLRLEASPASNIRLQVLSLDPSRDPARVTAHAREFNTGLRLDTVIGWEEFRIPAWFRDSLASGGDQRLELLARTFAVDIQSAYVGPGHDSMTLRILALEAKGPSLAWRLVGLLLILAGSLSSIASATLMIRAALLRTREHRLGTLVEGRKSVQLNTNRIRLRQEVQSALKERFAEPGLQLESFSSQLKMPARLVASLLKEATGLNFKPALNELRLAEAARLLRDSDAAVAEIGYAVGFQNPSHFGRAFRERYGASPSGWRGGDSAKDAKMPAKPDSTDSAESS